MNLNWNIEIKSELHDLEFFFILNLSGFIVKQNNFYLELLKPVFKLLSESLSQEDKHKLLENYYVIATKGYYDENKYLSLIELLNYFFNERD